MLNESPLMSIYIENKAYVRDAAITQASAGGPTKKVSRHDRISPVLTGVVAAVMLLAGDDNHAKASSGLQRITIVAALPFVPVMLLYFALMKDLRRDHYPSDGCSLTQWWNGPSERA